MEDASFMLNLCAPAKDRGDGDPAVRVCDLSSLRLKHFVILRMAHHNLVLRITGSQCRQRTDHRMSYANALEKVQCGSVERTIREQRLFFCGSRTTDDQ